MTEILLKYITAQPGRVSSNLIARQESKTTNIPTWELSAFNPQRKGKVKACIPSYKYWVETHEQQDQTGTHLPGKSSQALSLLAHRQLLWGKRGRHGTTGRILHASKHPTPVVDAIKD